MTTIWRCRRCLRVGPREVWTIRRGLITCGGCLFRHQLADLLEPVEEKPAPDMAQSDPPAEVQP